MLSKGQLSFDVAPKCILKAHCDTVLKTSSLLEVKKLTDDYLLRYQRRRCFDEHLVTFYSLAYGEPYVYKDTYLFITTLRAKCFGSAMVVIDILLKSRRLES